MCRTNPITNHSAQDVAADLLRLSPLLRPVLDSCSSQAIVQCKLMKVDEDQHAEKDIFREVREKLRDTGGIVEHEVPG